MIFYVPVVRQVALYNVPLRNYRSSQNFGKEPMLIFYCEIFPNKMIDCSDGRYWNFIKDLKVTSFI